MTDRFSGTPSSTTTDRSVGAASSVDTDRFSGSPSPDDTGRFNVNIVEGDAYYFGSRFFAAGFFLAGFWGRGHPYTTPSSDRLPGVAAAIITDRF